MNGDLSRRSFLTASAAVLTPLALTSCGPSVPGPGQPAVPWALTKPAPGLQIAGWVEQPSVVGGESIALHVNGLGSNANALCTTEVWRTGWHGGTGGAQYQPPLPVRLGPAQPLSVVTHPATKLDESEWPLTTLIETSTSGTPWPSGVYVIRLTGADGFQALVPVTIRDATPTAEVLVIQSHLTWQGYNAKFSHLYNGGSAVSFRRPYYFDDIKPSLGAGEYLWLEHRVVRWLEREGFSTTYAADFDLHLATVPPSVKTIVLSGHCEYWTEPMRVHLREAMTRGVGVVNLSANSLYWRGRIEPWRGGIRYDCYKTDLGGPHPDDPFASDPDRATVQYRTIGQPEQGLLGVMFDGWVDTPRSIPGTSSYSYPLTCVNTSHPVFAGTGITVGETFEALCAGEVDARIPGFGSVPNSTLAFRAQLPYAVGNRKDFSNPLVAETVLLEQPFGPRPSRVFSAGSYGWPYGLDNTAFDAFTYTYANDKISRLTANILRWSMYDL